MKLVLLGYAVGWAVFAFVVFMAMVGGRARRETVEGKAPYWAIAIIASSVGLFWPFVVVVLLVKIVVAHRDPEKRIARKLGVYGEEMKRQVAKRAAERVRDMKGAKP